MGVWRGLHSTWLYLCKRFRNNKVCSWNIICGEGKKTVSKGWSGWWPTAGNAWGHKWLLPGYLCQKVVRVKNTRWSEHVSQESFSTSHDDANAAGIYFCCSSGGGCGFLNVGVSGTTLAQAGLLCSTLNTAAEMSPVSLRSWGPVWGRVLSDAKLN